MSKIDCNITENFLRELNRATNNCNIYCKDCIINDLYMKDERGCVNAIVNHPQEAISIIQNWSDAHPLKTRLDDLKEKHPDFRLINDSGYPSLFPRVFGYCDGCQSCHLYHRTNRCESCWDEPVEGGATGK